VNEDAVYCKNINSIYCRKWETWTEY